VLFQTGQSDKARFWKLADYKAAVGDLNQAANFCHSLMAKISEMNVSNTLCCRRSLKHNDLL
jgi:hypothetical protein